MDLIEAYRLLELPVGASRATVREAYRDLLKVWHPDRHASDPPLQRRAEERLKRINAAFEAIELQGFPAAPGNEGNASTSEHDVDDDPEPKVTQETPRSSTTAPSPSTPSEPPPHRQAPQNAASRVSPTPSPNTGVRIAVALVVAVGATSIWAYYNGQGTKSQTFSSPTRSYEPPESPRYERAAEAIPSPPRTIEESSPPDRDPAPAAPSFLQATAGSTFTIGSTKEDVLAVQGTPSSIIGDAWSYEYSSVHFGNGRVEGYSNISNNLRLREPTQHAGSENSFAIGSTKEDVLAVQGTPSSIIGDTWQYEFSSVRFAGGRVEGYSNISNNLRLREPTQRAEAGSSFAIGSTKEDVLTVQGTPSSIIGDTWQYEFSSVRFVGGRVEGYSNISNNLRLAKSQHGPDVDGNK